MKRLPGWICVIGLSVLAASCGGGGGGGSSFTPAGEYAEISPVNAELIAGEALGATVGLTAVGGSDVFGSSAASASADVAVHGAAARLQKQQWQGDGATAAVVLPPLTDACIVGGTVTISGSVANLETLNPGDRVTFDFDACDDGDGMILDGRMVLRIRSFAGDLSGDQYRLDVDAQFDDFSTQPSGGGETVSGDGNVRLIVDSMSLPLLTGSASGSAFTLGWSGQARTLRDFASEFAYDGSAVPGTFTQEHRGTLSSPRFSGRVDYETLDMFQGAGEDPPFAGSLLITGRDEATILVTLLDDAGLQLDIDFDGDGTPDETRNTTWATVGQ